jgi:hypothetical protein
MVCKSAAVSVDTFCLTETKYAASFSCELSRGKAFLVKDKCSHFHNYHFQTG